MWSYWSGERWARCPGRLVVEGAHEEVRRRLRDHAEGPDLGVAGTAEEDGRLGPLLALEPAGRPADAANRLWIVDGTLVPVRDRHVGSSSRNYRFSANVQVVVDADTRLVIAVVRPVPGTTADAPADDETAQ
jgi:hypothetical protein